MARAKMSGTYPNSVLATLEATKHGYDEGLLLDVDGFVAEGAGENIFIVKDGVILEPELTSALTGITRSSVIDLAEVSAGGGSIAWIDPGGALKLGPESAGAVADEIADLRKIHRGGPAQG